MPVRGMIVPWDATLPSEQRLTCSRPRQLQRRLYPKATTETAPQRYVLPKNLRNAVKHLSDGELDLMHAATVEEIEAPR